MAQIINHLNRSVCSQTHTELITVSCFAVRIICLARLLQKQVSKSEQKWLISGAEDHQRDLGRSCPRLLHVNHRLAILCRRAQSAGRHVLRSVHGGRHLQLPAAVRLLLDHADRHVLAVRRHLPRGAAASAASRGQASATHRHALVSRRRHRSRRVTAAAATTGDGGDSGS